MVTRIRGFEEIGNQWGGKVLAGLVKRRAAEAALYMS